MPEAIQTGEHLVDRGDKQRAYDGIARMLVLKAVVARQRAALHTALEAERSARGRGYSFFDAPPGTRHRVIQKSVARDADGQQIQPEPFFGDRLIVGEIGLIVLDTEGGSVRVLTPRDRLDLVPENDLDTQEPLNTYFDLSRMLEKETPRNYQEA